MQLTWAMSKSLLCRRLAPSDTVIPQLKAKGIKHVILMPMMMVAGDHANNDMAGADADSHKSILERRLHGYDLYPWPGRKMKRSARCSSNGLMKLWNALEAQ